MDIFSNTFFNCVDDGIELDGSDSNIRVWDNVIINAEKHGISAQPQASGVWYIINNHIEGVEMSGSLKLYEVDNMVITGNTFINTGVLNKYYGDLAVLRKYLKRLLIAAAYLASL